MWSPNSSSYLVNIRLLSPLRCEELSELKARSMLLSLSLKGRPNVPSMLEVAMIPLVVVADVSAAKSATSVDMFVAGSISGLPVWLLAALLAGDAGCDGIIFTASGDTYEVGEIDRGEAIDVAKVAVDGIGADETTPIRLSIIAISWAGEVTAE